MKECVCSLNKQCQLEHHRAYIINIPLYKLNLERNKNQKWVRESAVPYGEFNELYFYFMSRVMSGKYNMYTMLSRTCFFNLENKFFWTNTFFMNRNDSLWVILVLIWIFCLTKFQTHRMFGIVGYNFLCKKKFVYVFFWTFVCTFLIIWYSQTVCRRAPMVRNRIAFAVKTKIPKIILLN